MVTTYTCFVYETFINCGQYIKSWDALFVHLIIMLEILAVGYDCDLRCFFLCGVLGVVGIPIFRYLCRCTCIN